MKRGRTGIVIVIIVALLLSAVTRDWARSMRNSGDVATASGGTPLAEMNSFSLALLLGGLRGPLVMILWTSSENQKNEKNLEDFDTQVEWIRLLQPEFDSVHIFQMWNKAYNISVQMASLSNKYAAVLDAIDYGRRVLDQRPNDINIVYGIGSLFFDKFGNANEKGFYRYHVRAETFPDMRVSVPKERAAELAAAIRTIHLDPVDLPKRDDLATQAARDGRVQVNGLVARALQGTLPVTVEAIPTKVLGPGQRRTRLDPKLDVNGNILPELLAPKKTRPTDLSADDDFNNGAELQYLEKYQPFPYGISTFALGYAYHRQAQVLQNVGKQRHVNLSEMVVDSRPSAALRTWSEEEWERGRRLELWSFNLPAPEEKRELEVPTANIAVDTPFASREVIAETIYCYDTSQKLALDSVVEYESHLKRFANNYGTYQATMDGMRGQIAMMQADRDYLKAMLASGAERARLLKSAGDEYRHAEQWNLFVILRYYMNDYVAPQVLPKGMTRSDLSRLPPEQYRALYDKMRTFLPPGDPEAEDRSDYERAVDRAETRLKRLQ